MEILISILKKLNIIPVPLVDTQPQFLKARIVLEANRLGIFRALGEANDGLNTEELAERLGISREGAAVMLTALTNIDYLVQRNGHYRNSRWVKRWILDPKRGISNFLNLQLHTWSRLEYLEETLRTGRPVKDFHQAEVTKPGKGQEVYTRGMREIARFLIPAFIKRAKLPQGAKRLLDVGGAHGDYSRALVRRFPGLKATVLDMAGPIATAQQILETEGNPEGIELRVGNVLKDDLGNGWDAVLLANMVHLFSLDQNNDLFTRIHGSLAPNGVLLIMDQFMGLGRLQDKLAGLFSLNCFIVGGRCYPREDMERLLKKAGFSRIKVKPFLLQPPTSLIEAWKPNR
ncbi:methyltransferase [bacterium]|nr:methyltransferase [bacterium]MBU1614734.1 methyltransferase [bacterium]